GFYLYRKRYLKEEVLNFLTFFVINFSIPFLIFSRLVKNASLVLKYPLVLFLSLSVGIFLSGLLLGIIFSLKKNHPFRKEFISCVSFQNCGYLPMNIALFLFSSPLQEEFLVYVFLYILGFNIIIWSVGSFFIFKRKDEDFKIKSIFSPPVISTIFALFLIYPKIHYLIPNFFLSILEMIGNLSFALSMIILGGWLAKVELKGVYENIFLIIKAAFLKSILLPLISLFFLYYLKVSSLLGLFILLESSMPSAVSLPIVASLRRANTGIVSQIVFFTHIMSIFTIPFWLTIYLRFCGFYLGG
ncbi:MAG TPA: hypothetical protein EYP89_03860, partial [Candidatus Omnitrophica bacterium]|nr:hypothetical protein [Candidatus Omnitrophota bacterium]